MDWHKQIVLVTGGAGGIGSAIVKQIVARGGTAVVLDRVAAADTNERVKSFVCDLTDDDQVQATMRKIRNEVGPVTVLVNSAGIVSGKLIQNITADEFRKTLEVNVVAPARLVKAVLPDMLAAKRGHVISIASVFAHQGCSQLSDYSASKHALRGLHSSLRQELDHHHHCPSIRTTLVYPGHVKTPLFGSIKPPSRVVRFLAPQVYPADVARKVVSAIEDDTNGEIYLPWYGGVLWVLDGLPSWVRDTLVWISDANEAMTTFKNVDRTADKR